MNTLTVYMPCVLHNSVPGVGGAEFFGIKLGCIASDQVSFRLHLNFYLNTTVFLFIETI